MPYPEGTVFKDSYVARVAYTQYRRIKEETKTSNMKREYWIEHVFGSLYAVKYSDGTYAFTAYEGTKEECAKWIDKQ